jgi:protein-S-isoprenylcysteine O-methyltransferase Ste14
VISSPYRYLGVIPLSVSVAIVLWAAGIFRRVGTAIKPFEPSTVLVISGPYRISRNPIYLGMVCALVGVGVALGSLAPFVVVPFFGYWIDRRFIRVEESMLGETFGSEYHAYKTRVRRWLQFDPAG